MQLLCPRLSFESELARLAEARKVDELIRARVQVHKRDPEVYRILYGFFTGRSNFKRTLLYRANKLLKTFSI